jgi:hypothetical protein
MTLAPAAPTHKPDRKAGHSDHAAARADGLLADARLAPPAARPQSPGALGGGGIVTRS